MPNKDQHFKPIETQEQFEVALKERIERAEKFDYQSERHCSKTGRAA